MGGRWFERCVRRNTETWEGGREVARLSMRGVCEKAAMGKGRGRKGGDLRGV